MNENQTVQNTYPYKLQVAVFQSQNISDVEKTLLRDRLNNYSNVYIFDVKENIKRKYKIFPTALPSLCPSKKGLCLCFSQRLC